MHISISRPAISRPVISAIFVRIAAGAAISAAVLCLHTQGAFALSPLNGPCNEADATSGATCYSPQARGANGPGASSSPFNEISRDQPDYIGTSDSVRAQFYIEPKRSRSGSRAHQGAGWGREGGYGFRRDIGDLRRIDHPDTDIGASGVNRGNAGGTHGIGGAPWLFRGSLQDRR